MTKEELVCVQEQFIQKLMRAKYPASWQVGQLCDLVDRINRNLDDLKFLMSLEIGSTLSIRPYSMWEQKDSVIQITGFKMGYETEIAAVYKLLAKPVGSHWDTIRTLRTRLT